MNWKIAICILTGLIIFSQNSSAQSQDDLRTLNKLFSVEKEAKKIPVKINTENELQLILTTGFSFYKKYVSPQDALSCSFYPSCSAYALQTLQVNGIFGIFDAIDRLTRCNGFSPEKYETHQNSHLFYDPVKNIHKSH